MVGLPKLIRHLIRNRSQTYLIKRKTALDSKSNGIRFSADIGLSSFLKKKGKQNNKVEK